MYFWAGESTKLEPSLGIGLLRVKHQLRDLKEDIVNGTATRSNVFVCVIGNINRAGRGHRRLVVWEKIGT